MSQKIAIKVLMKLNELGWSQKDLAAKMEVSPQQVNKIVSGKENLTLETQEKLQCILDIPVLASYYEDKIKAFEKFVNLCIKSYKESYIKQVQLTSKYTLSKVVTMGVNPFIKNEISKKAV